jgi:RHH-type proline utilization regulon transcriptional repressor/proline dehydrogenase/delta 1-pyrroline-5-carboxylate dehydrogenase
MRLRRAACSGRETIMPGPTGEENRYRMRGRGPFVLHQPWNLPARHLSRPGHGGARRRQSRYWPSRPSKTPLIAFERCASCTRQACQPAALHYLPATARSERRWSTIPRIAGVAFTGSTQVAQTINRALAAKNGPIVPMIAETGGINAIVADATALPEQVADDVVASSFRSAGQRCSASRLLFVQEDVADGMLSMIAGPPMRW